MSSLFASMSDINLDSFKEDSNKKFNNALFANGLWQKRKEPVGTFTIKVEDIDGSKYGLKNNCEFDYIPALPKMPSVIFFNILQFYRDVEKKCKSEVYVSVYWDKIKQDYFLYVPKQRVAGASVTFENDPEMLNNPNYFIVMDNHSHVNFSAFWSAQDIRDQAASRLFGVIGKISSDTPEYLITAGANRQEKELDFDEAFDRTVDKLHEDSDYSIPANAFEQITEYVAPAPVTKSSYKGGYGKPYTPPKSYWGADDSYDYGYGGYANSYYNVYSDKTYLDLTKKARDLFSATKYVESDIIRLSNAFVDFLYDNLTANKTDMTAEELQNVLTDISFSFMNTCEEIVAMVTPTNSDKGDINNVNTNT